MPRKKSLPFKDINPRLGADELIKRLKACLKYVEECDDLDATISSDLLSLSATLVSPAIVSHKQREVPLLSACILICIIKLFYDDLPFGEEQIKGIFSLFIAQMSALENPSSTLFNWSYTLLENISTLKVFTYCLDIEAPDVLIDLFRKVLSVLSPDQSSQVRSLLLDILVDILQEAKQILPMEAFDTLMTHLLEPQKSKNPVAYEFVCQLIKKTSLHLEHYVHIFYSSCVSDRTSSTLTVSSRLYEAIQALHEVDSTVLLSVLPQLETQLQTVDEGERLEVTRALAKMFGAKESRLSTENRPLWQSFLGRFQDVSTIIRSECVTFSKYFLVYHPHLRDSTSEKLMQRLLDSDEKVRLTVVKTICDVAIQDLSCVSDKVFCALQERMRDRKWAVRKETIQSVCRVHRHVMSRDSLSQSERDKVIWIPNKLLHCLFQKIRDDNVIVTRALLSCIVPVSLDPDDKIDRLLEMYHTLDENAVRAFTDFIKNRKRLRQLIKDTITIHQDSNLKDDERKKLLLTKTISINSFLPDPAKSQDHMRELISALPEISLNLKESVDVRNDYQKITKAKADVLSKFSSRPLVCETMKSVLDMSCPVLVDRKCIEVLVGRVTKELCDPTLSYSEEEEEEEQVKCKKGISLIKMLCIIEPSWFEQEPVLTDLLTVLRHEDQQIVENAILSLTKVGRAIEEWSTVSGCLQPILVGFVTKGSPRVAKLSLKCLHRVYSETDLLVDRALKNLISSLDLDHPQLLTALSSLGQIARLYPQKFYAKHKLIISKFAVAEILDVDNGSSDSMNGELWCEKDELEYETKLKVACIKLLVSWVIGLHSDNHKEREKHLKPVLELLTRVLETDGDLKGNGLISLADQSHMRLMAATAFLKLVRHGGCVEYITTEQFQLLAMAAQDPCDEVRELFVTKLYEGLRTFTLPLHYLSMFSLTKVAKEKLTKAKLKEMLAIIIKSKRDYYNSMKKKESLDSVKTAQLLPEYSIPYVVYIISHHTAFSRTKTDRLNFFRDYLWSFLEPLVSKTENFGFLQKMLDGIKEMVCADDPLNMELNKNVYAVCDLIMGILHDKKTTVSWGEFPGKVILPKLLYKSRGKNASPNDIKYLPPDYKIFPDKISKSEVVKRSNGTPRKRGRTSKKNNQNNSDISVSVLETSLSDIEATPSPKKKRNTPTKLTNTRTRSPKKQTKLTFKTKQLPITSTPAITVKPEKKGKSTVKRKALQQENTRRKKPKPESTPRRTSPRKRKLETSVIEEEKDEYTEERNVEDEPDRSDKGEEEVGQSPPVKVSKMDAPHTSTVNGTPPITPPLPTHQIKNRRRVKRRR